MDVEKLSKEITAEELYKLNKMFTQEKVNKIGSEKELKAVVLISTALDFFVVPNECLRPYLREAIQDVLIEEQLVRSNKSRPSINAELFLGSAKDIKTGGRLPLDSYYIKVNDYEVDELNDKLVIKYRPELFAESFVGNIRFAVSPRKLNVVTNIKSDEVLEVLKFVVTLIESGHEIAMNYVVEVQMKNGEINTWSDWCTSDMYLACFRIEL